MTCYDLMRDVHLSNFQAFEQNEIVRQGKIVIDWGMEKIHVCVCVAKEKNFSGKEMERLKEKETLWEWMKQKGWEGDTR